MSKTKYRLRNVAGRPIELHGGEEVVIIPARATIDVDEVDEAHSALIARGLLTCHAGSPAPTPPQLTKSQPRQRRAKATRAPRSSPAKPRRPKGGSA